MRILIICILLILFASITNAFSQSSWYAGLELSYNLDYQYHLQSGNFAEDLTYSKSSFGLVLGRSFKNQWSLETGIISKTYNLNGLSQVFPGQRIGIPRRDYITLQIPVRLSTQIPVVGNQVSITPTIGYSMAFNRNHTSYGEGGGGLIVSGDNIVRSERRYTDHRLAQNFSLLETGIGLSFRIVKKVDFNIHGKYYHSLTDAVSREVVDYTLNGEPVPQIQTISTGSYLNFGVGIRYHF